MHRFFSKLNILAGMKYFKIFMIEHLKNSLRLEILSRNELHVPQRVEELVRRKISVQVSIFQYLKLFRNAQTPTFDLQKIVPGNLKKTLAFFVNF